jgi:hypothetical protein
MMGFKGVHCESLAPKTRFDADSASRAMYDKRRTDLVIDLVDPICVISNANEILSHRLGKFVDDETRSYFDMVSRAITKTTTLIEEMRNENNL